MYDIDEIYYDAIDLLKAMVAVPSFSREEKAVADVVEQAMTKFGLCPSAMPTMCGVKAKISAPISPPFAQCAYRHGEGG